MVLLSSKCDTSGCQGCQRLCLLQRPFNGRPNWRELSLANARPAPLLWGWERAGNCQQDSRPMVLQSWAAVACPLAPWPVPHLHPMPDATHHKALCPIHHSVSSVSAAFLLFDQKGRLWAMSACQKYMSFPCLVTAGRGTRRPPCKEMGRTKILVNRGAKEVECETLCPLRSEADFPENPMRSVLHQEREAESWKLESVHKEAGFLFS